MNTPGAVPAQPRASGSCGAPQRLKEALGERRNIEVRLEIAYHLPQPERQSRRGSKRDTFGSRNRPGTYFEEPQSHKHFSTSVQIP